MSIYSITTDVDLDLLLALLRGNLRYPDGIAYANGIDVKPTGIEYVTDLTPTEQALFSALVEKASAPTRFKALPDWSTYTIEQATAAITSAIFNGQSQADVEAAITTAITNAPNTIAGVKTVMGQLFIQAADQIIAIRSILVAMGKMLVWLRNIVLALH